MKEQTKRLKPCPFCGSNEVRYVKAGCMPNTPKEFADWVYVLCLNCHCTTEAYKSIDELTWLWNKRTDAVMDNKGLKTCPHCGKKARIYIMSKGNYRAECATDDNYECCHTCPGFNPNKKEAIKVWNRRVHDEHHQC